MTFWQDIKDAIFQDNVIRENKPKIKLAQDIALKELKRRESSFEPTPEQEQQVKDWNKRKPIKEVFKNDI